MQIFQQLANCFLALVAIIHSNIARELPSVTNSKCAEISFQQPKEISFSLKANEQVLDFPNIQQYIQQQEQSLRESSSISTETIHRDIQFSLNVAKNCTLNLFSNPSLKGIKHSIKHNDKNPKWVPKSASCECTKTCDCKQVNFRQGECARAYYDQDCTVCTAPFVLMSEGIKVFPIKWSSTVKSIVIRHGCSLTLKYNKADRAKTRTFVASPDRSHKLVKDIKSYTITEHSCECSETKTYVKVPVNNGEKYPVPVSIPTSVEEITSLLANDKTSNHPGLIAALQTASVRRSSRNAYILLLGLTGSGKSSTVNLLFNQNITETGEKVSTTSDILEFAIPVPVPQLGISNAEIHVIDTPGIADTRGIDQDASYLATLDAYLANHQDLKRNLPNVVLIFAKFSDNRFSGDESNFVKMIRTIELFKDRIIDQKSTNIVFVLTHAMSANKADIRNPVKRIATFRSVIEEFSTLPKPIKIVLAENIPDAYELDSVNGYYRLPHGEFYPKNLFDMMTENMLNNGDSMGEAIITTAFTHLNALKVPLPKVHKLLPKTDPGVTRYLHSLGLFLTPINNTEVTKKLNEAYKTLPSSLKEKYPTALNLLQRSFFRQNILDSSHIPQTTQGILRLLENTIGLNPASMYLLKNAFNLTMPVFKGHVSVGSGYSLLLDKTLPASIFDTSKYKPTVLGYQVPDAFNIELINAATQTFNVFPEKLKYIDARMNSLGLINYTLNGNLYAALPESFPGFNIKSNSSWSSLTAAVNFVRFKISLNGKANLSEKFQSALARLEPLDLKNDISVQNWNTFFGTYGTHVVIYAFGGGSIQVTAGVEGQNLGLANEEKLVVISETLQNVSQQLANGILYNVSQNNMRKPFQLPTNVYYKLSQMGGDSKFFWSNFSGEDHINKVYRWKESLKYEPVILQTGLQLFPISGIIQKFGASQNIAHMIEVAAEKLLNSSLLIVPIQTTGNDKNNPATRDDIDIDHTGGGTGDFELVKEFSNMFKTMADQNKFMQQQILQFINETQQQQFAKEAKWEEDMKKTREEYEKRTRDLHARYNEQAKLDLELEKLRLEQMEKEAEKRMALEKVRILAEAQRVKEIASIRSKSEDRMLQLINTDNERRARTALLNNQRRKSSGSEVMSIVSGGIDALTKGIGGIVSLFPKKQ